MKIKLITSRHRRDFTADYICESCGHITTGYGYDDNYFHETVIPNMVCCVCGEKSKDYTPLTPRYSEHEVI